MIQFAQSIYDVERKRPEKIKLTRDGALTAGMITKSKWLIEEARNSEEEVNVCEAMDRYVQKVADEARLEGKVDEQRNVLITQLTTKLGNLSKQVIEKITKASSYELKQLTISIFNIESEDDIINIIQ